MPKAHNKVQRSVPARRGRTAKPRKRLPRYDSQTDRQKSIYDRTSSLVSDLRAGRGTYPELLRKYHLASRTARKYAGHDLLSGKRGKPVRASKSDRRVRDVWFPTSLGDVPFRTRDSRDATKLSEFFNDRGKLLRGKLSPEDFEAKWLGVRVAGREIFADAADILSMPDDELKVEDLYASTTNSR